MIPHTKHWFSRADVYERAAMSRDSREYYAFSNYPRRLTEICFVRACSVVFARTRLLADAVHCNHTLGRSGTAADPVFGGVCLEYLQGHRLS